MIAISVGMVFAGDELFTRNFAHGGQQARIANAAGTQLLVDHAGALMPLALLILRLAVHRFRLRTRTSKLTTPFSSRIASTVYSLLMLYSN